MDGEAVTQLAQRLRGPMEVGGMIARPDDWTLEDPAGLIKPGPAAKTLMVSTLGAVRDYLEGNKDKLAIDRTVVHVMSPNRVDVLGPLDDRSMARQFFVCAQQIDMSEGFLGRFMPLEEAILGLQVRFANADERGRLIGLLSNVKHEQVKTSTDDGVTQVVQARAGVVLVSEVAVPNPVLLCGIRAFRDIPQVSSLYVVRVNSGKSGGLPEVGLFEADGGAWRLVAIERIAEWLHAALPVGVSVLA